MRERGKGAVDEAIGNKDCVTYNDFREILERPDIDAVHIATPDHWHTQMVIMAVRSGKDVYVQKPETRTLREGKQMVDAARQYARVVSGGSQRVLEDYRRYVDPAWSGEMGTLKSINVNTNFFSEDCFLESQPVPERTCSVGALQCGARPVERLAVGRLASMGRLFRRPHHRLGLASFGWSDVCRGRAGASADRSELRPGTLI